MTIADVQTYPVADWIAPPTIDAGTVPRWFRAQVEPEYDGYLAAERAKFADWSGMADEWNARGEKSQQRKLAGSAGAWHGARHIVAGLVTTELAGYWSEVSARLTLTDYVAARWIERNGERDIAIREAERHAESVAEPVLGETVTDGVMFLTGVAGPFGPMWQVVTDDAGEPVREFAGGGDVERVAASMAASGMFTDTMIARLRDAYLDGVTRRKGRVIVEPGDIAAAAVYACGPVPAETRRGVALADALAAYAGQVRQLPMYAPDSVPF